LPERLTNPEYWQKCAEDMRALATHMNDPDGKRTLVRVAEDYDMLAAIVSARTQPSASTEQQTQRALVVGSSDSEA
jgi:hypothetical protein